MERQFSSPSSTRNPLNGDRPLSIYGKLRYLANCWTENREPYQPDSQGLFTTFSPVGIDSIDKLALIRELPTPARGLSELVWMSLPWEKIKARLGEIRLMDIGCGSGRYAAKFANYSSQRIDSYVGLDVAKAKEWDGLASDRVHFQTIVPGQSLEGIYRTHRTNFIFSQSVLEHVENDHLLLDDLKKAQISYPWPSLQIHMVPSAECLALYRWHGYRQYNRQRMTEIARVYSDSAHVKVLRLGSQRSIQVHRRYVASLLRGDRRDQESDSYFNALVSAIKHDAVNPSQKTAFYALLIVSKELGSDFFSELDFSLLSSAQN
jgi:hypothetical protein